MQQPEEHSPQQSPPPASQEQGRPAQEPEAASGAQSDAPQPDAPQSNAAKAMSSYAYDPPSTSSAGGGKPKPKGLLKIMSRLAAGVTVVGCVILIIAVTFVSNLLKGLTDAIHAQSHQGK